MILKILNCQKWGEKSRKFLDFYIWFLMSSQIYKNMVEFFFFPYMVYRQTWIIFLTHDYHYGPKQKFL